ncbi:uncharacterized protein LOC133745252 isoform X2 [Rosa rugosa]|uniref:uncharacterized protein LOC133745252 isoform X2 n=1 Tax=Rosa rugosa TaxID=74645 RepID=UPI002B40B8F4|nr:uncharacterized protein LOC133745252 isoform X2 [Rosa rugosa]
MRNDATSDIQFMISLSRMLMATMWILVCTRGMFYLLSMLPNVCVPKACFTYSQSILENSIAPNLCKSKYKIYFYFLTVNIWLTSTSLQLILLVSPLKDSRYYLIDYLTMSFPVSIPARIKSNSGSYRG